jgi:hypothetical protein
MNNITAFGNKHLSTYLRDYAAGSITFKVACAYIACCFNDIEG